ETANTNSPSWPELRATTAFHRSSSFGRSFGRSPPGLLLLSPRLAGFVELERTARISFVGFSASMVLAVIIGEVMFVDVIVMTA
ncbi:MAG: hypothetical protein WAM78_12325, partial [Candidatus Sulfotelmatobacter sp.]